MHGCSPSQTLGIGVFRFVLTPARPLVVPAVNKGNMLRGGFGHAFRRLCCIPQCRDTKSCPLANSCPYKAVFEPSPPPGADRLSKNQDIPRPFIFRPPLEAAPDVAPDFSPALEAAPDVTSGDPSRRGLGRTCPDPIGNPALAAPSLRSGQALKGGATKTHYERGEPFEFGLVLVGRALDFLPYFVLSFRDLAEEGLGLNRARCVLERVEAGSPRHSVAPGSPRHSVAPGECAVILTLSAAKRKNPGIVPKPALVYSADDQLFRAPEPCSAQAWIDARLSRLSTVNSRLSTSRITIRFLTPTFLRADGEIIRRPEFHHLFKRLRDRINALCTFFGDGPLDVDFRGLGERAERVKTISAQIDWVERFRTSSKTRQRHELSGFVGECIYEFPTNDSEVSNLELLKWLLAGELIHVGRHTAWGNGSYVIV